MYGTLFVSNMHARGMAYENALPPDKHLAVQLCNSINRIRLYNWQSMGLNE